MTSAGMANCCDHAKAADQATCCHKDAKSSCCDGK